MSPAHVLHILWAGRSGGAELLVKDIALLSDPAVSKHSVCFLSEGGRLENDLVRAGIPVYVLKMRSGFSAGAAWRLVALIHKVDPDVIHSHVANWFANFLLIFFPGKKRIYFEHGGKLLGESPGKTLFFYRTVGRLFDVVCANSKHVAGQLTLMAGVAEKRLRVVYPGILCSRFGASEPAGSVVDLSGIPATAKVIGVVGRLEKSKAMDDFIRTASLISKKRADAHFVIAGAGSQKDALMSLANELGVSVVFLGDCKDVPNLLKRFDLYVFTSRWESFGITVLEALASGVPVVGFSVPGMAEIFEKGGGGELLKERDHKALADKALALLEDTAAYDRLRREGIDNVKKNFEISILIEALERLYSAEGPARKRSGHG